MEIPPKYRRRWWDHHSGSLKIIEERSAAFLMKSANERRTINRIFVPNNLWDVKEPMALFEK